MAGNCGCGDCKDCKRVREHIASVLPVRILEAAAAGKSLRIAGVAMAAGISRNFNIYTPDELQAFAEKLVGAPVYLEHVVVSAVSGKVTKGTYDASSRCVLYEAEIYDQAVAEKIRNGLIQHVSVGADYQAIDVVDAKIYHGLYNPELSLVAVPGVPETTIQVLEHLAHVHTSVPASGKDHKPVKVVHEKVSAKELLQDLQCVFCGKPGEYLVSVCTSCGDNAQSLVLPALEHLPVRELHLTVREAADDLPTLFSAFRVRFVASPDACEKCKALDGKEFVYGQEPGLPHDGCKCPGYRLVERLVVHVNRLGVEKLEEKDMDILAEKTVTKVNEKLSGENKGLKEKLSEAERQLGEANTKVSEADGKIKGAESARDSAKTELAAANKLLEKYRKVAPGVELSVNPPVLMPVAECLDILGRLELPKMQERLSLGNQLQAQKVRKEIYEVKKKYEVK
jgi:hypothetical protein